MKAVSCIFKVNILIFLDEGQFYFGQMFNTNYERMLCIAYRTDLSQKSTEQQRNHYDSVLSIEQNRICDYPSSLVMAYQQNVFENSVIVLDDSIIE